MPARTPQRETTEATNSSTLGCGALLRVAFGVYYPVWALAFHERKRKVAHCELKVSEIMSSWNSVASLFHLLLQ